MLLHAYLLYNLFTNIRDLFDKFKHNQTISMLDNDFLFQFYLLSRFLGKASWVENIGGHKSVNPLITKLTFSLTR